MPQARIWFNFNSHTIELLGLHDNDLPAGDPQYWRNAATVAGELIDEDEARKQDAGDSYTPVKNVTLTALGAGVPVTRDGVTYDEGNYRAVFPEDPTWIEKVTGRKERHFVQVIADDGVNRDGFWREPLILRDREFAE